MEKLHTKLQALTLLIVEDDESTLKWLERILSIYFKEVKVANNAMDAFAIFRKEDIDVIVADIQIPEVDGLHLLQKIASVKPSCIRIVMTAFNNHIYLNRAIDAEVDFYFKKPIDIDELLVSISLSVKNQKKIIDKIKLKNNYIYDSVQKMIINKDSKINLTKKESLLFELLYENRNTIVSLEYIENSIWEEPTTNEAIRMVISSLRKKLYENSIQNIKGFGYKLCMS
ncbi:transcriptional regulator [Malaciobacter canalis]|jgi:DNA-binding response OmpR family regulator|uniref:Transcriptional regulator n=1 Tax=Malaciobacter canalis TaxID=1912871 RepID=A0ABX4LNV4_9BACT|nr:response regulator transcription factor [Malaciobacter canalis]PHO09574.1 transcriptional regulator [Malaciobacter canalis]QEE31640.1 two-component system response regulator [Malaciobacter canalis]